MGSNSMLTPLIIQSLNLHNSIFSKMYPFPLKIRINSQSQIQFTMDNPYKAKYGFFVFMEVVISFLFAFCCSVLLMLGQKFLPPGERMRSFEVVMCICLCSMNMLEWGTYVWMVKETEFFPAVNQLMEMDQQRN